MNTHEGYSKKTISNANVLLAGGGDKSLADFLGGIRISASKIQYKTADVAASWTDLITLTDENVKLTPKTDNVNRPLMMINGGTSAGELTSTSMFSAGIYANAYTNSITATGIITASKFHSNASASTDLTVIPTDAQIALETGNGNGGVSAWIWREQYASSNWGIFHNNSTNEIIFVGGSAARVRIALGGNSLKVGGTEVSLNGHTHDDRYYTEAESNSRYVLKSGDIMSGTLTITKYGPTVYNYVKDNWAFQRFTAYTDSTTNMYDIGTYPTRNTFEIRRNGGDNWAFNPTAFFGYADNTYYLGTTSYRWANIYSTLGNFSSTVTASGFIHSAVNSNDYVLLAGGSYKYLGDISWYTWTADLSGLSNTNYYPVLVNGLPKWRRIKIKFNDNNAANFSERNDGCHIWFAEEISGSGWSGPNGLSRIIHGHEEWGGNGKGILVKVAQMTNSSKEVFWLRGGAKYKISSDYYGLSITCGATSYTYNNETVNYISGLQNHVRLTETATSYQGAVTGARVWYAYNSTNAGNADTLDGYHFLDLENRYKLKSSRWIPETKLVREVLTTYLDNTNTNLHNQGYDEINFFRFYAQSDEGAYSTTYGYPVVDQHIMVFSIDNNKNWLRALSFDIRTDDIYSKTKSSSTWRDSWIKFLHSGNTYVSSGTGVINGTTITQVNNADTVDSYHASDLAKVNSYTLPSNKGVRITYSSHTPTIVSVSGNNSGGQLIIIGTGYGEGGRTRNQFTELVSCSLFDWSIPDSNSISCSVEIFSRRNSNSIVKVISTDGVSFTSIDALTSAKENATLLTSSNYTNYVYSKTLSDDRYVNVTGDIMTGALKINKIPTSHSDPSLGICYESDTTTDDYSISYLKFGNTTYDAYLGIAPAARTYFGKVGYFYHIGTNYEFDWMTPSWLKRMALEAKTGNLWILGSLGLGITAETKLDVNGILQIYQRGLDNTAFKNLLLLKALNSSETSGDNWGDTYPTFGIGFRRYWTSSGNPYGETTCAGIYATISGSWRGGLVFRTKNNQTQGGTHDMTALRLAPSSAAFFATSVTAGGTIKSTYYGPAFAAHVATGSWSYMSYKSGSSEWHIGLNDAASSYIGQGSAFEIRSLGASYSGISVRYNTSSLGKLVVSVPSGECSIGYYSNGAVRWTVGCSDGTNFGWYLGSNGGWKMTLNTSGDLTATNFYTTSDRNKKTNISSFSEHIRKFQLKDTEKWHYGVIAQEVEEMFRDGEEGNMTVNYNSVLSYYIGQLENKVKMLEDEIKELKNKLK